MRPDYDGIKYYGKNDMSIGWALEDSEEKLQAFSSESTVENVNEAIELFNIAQLLDTEVRLRKWDEDTYNEYKVKSPLLMKLCAKFFQKSIMIALWKLKNAYVFRIWKTFGR